MTREEIAAFIAEKLNVLNRVSEAHVLDGEEYTVGVTMTDGAQFFVEVDNA